MIDPSELRINNYVYINNVIRQLNVKSFEYAVCNDRCIDVRPIIITPELLEKCGFIKDGFHAYNLYITNKLQTHPMLLYFSGDYLYLRQENNNRRFDDSVITLWNKNLMKVFYLHQLQNLYFALTGTELDINL